jgi:dienelactone hydrolase
LNAGSPFQGQLQTAAVSLMGHSTSGSAAIDLAVGGQLSVAALALLAPAGGASTVATFAPKPVIVLRGTRDTGSFGDRGESDNVYAAAGPKKHKVTIDGGNHFGFTDALCILFDPAATVSQADQQKIAKAYLTAFFHRHIHGTLEVEDYLNGARQVEELEGFAVTVEAQM